MTDNPEGIDREAFTAIDQRRLLRVLSRAIDEEAVHLYGAAGSDEWKRNRERLRVFCTLVSMIREMDEGGPDSRTIGAGRRASRCL